MRAAGPLARALAARIDRLAPELLPHGRRDGHEWRAGSLAGEPGKSLGVHLHGQRAGVWADFATGECGDALDLVAAVLYRGDRRQAQTWARRWLGEDDAQPMTERRRQPIPSAGAQPDDKRIGAARHLFYAARPSLAGTPAAAYLAGRGIDLADLGRQPRALRFHPSLLHRPSGRILPALVAAVAGPDGLHIATHRTWIERDGDSWIKARIEPPKMSLGPVYGGSIRLWRGASGTPLREASADEWVAIGEGIETCLSVAIACPELRILAAVSIANLASVALPPQIRRVLLLADTDDGEAARRGLRRAIDRHQEAGRAVRVARSPVGSDFNDLLNAEPA